MLLRSHGRLDDAITTVQDLRTKAQNCESAGRFDLAKKAYLDWVDNAHNQLHNLVEEADVAEGLTSQTYWEIYRLEYEAPGAWALLRREIRVQSDRLDRFRDRLVEPRDFAAHPGRVVVPDTSALVQGVWFEDLDWVSALRLEPSVRLVVPILVVEELDGIKDRDGFGRAGKRARKVLKRLREVSGQVSPGEPAPVRSGVTVEVLVDDDWHQRRPNHDGEIIHQALALQAATGCQVVLTCVDAAMEFRARQRGLKAVSMPTPNVKTASDPDDG